MNKNSPILPGVSCDVSNCVYNGHDHMCHAEHIQVETQASNCDCDAETFCGTFEAR